MTAFLNLLSGGFLSGYRTYLLGFILALQAFIAFAVGDINLTEFIQQLPEIIGGLGLMALRAGMSSGNTPNT